MGQRQFMFCDYCRAEHGGQTTNRRMITVRSVRVILPDAAGALVAFRMDLCEVCLGSLTLKQFLEKATEEK